MTAIDNIQQSDPSTTAQGAATSCNCTVNKNPQQQDKLYGLKMAWPHEPTRPVGVIYWPSVDICILPMG